VEHSVTKHTKKVTFPLTIENALFVLNFLYCIVGKNSNHALPLI